MIFMGLILSEWKLRGRVTGIIGKALVATIFAPVIATALILFTSVLLIGIMALLILLVIMAIMKILARL